MKVIGLTGGIGCGKSYVAKLAESNFPVYHINTDEMARNQMKKGGESYYKVLEGFKEYKDIILDEDQEINRKELSKIVFNDSTALKKLDDITHPAVIEEIRNIIAREKELNRFTAVIIESALVFESGINSMCDEVWYVFAPVDTRIRRLMNSRGYSMDKINAVLSGQMKERDFIEKSDRVIENDDDVSTKELLRIIGELLADG